MKRWDRRFSSDRTYRLEYLLAQSRISIISSPFDWRVFFLILVNDTENHGVKKESTIMGEAQSIYLRFLALTSALLTSVD